MTSQQSKQVDNLIIDRKISDREATILRLLAEDMDDFNLSELTELFEDNIITVGFTIDQLDTLLNEFTAERLTEGPGQRLIGWVFYFPKPSANTPAPLISDITVNRMDLNVTSTGSSFTQTELKHGTNPTRITLTPQIFFQRRTVTNTQMQVPYGPAFDATQPRTQILRSLPISTLEGYFPWADLAMLVRSDLDNFVDYILRGNTAYTDLFFSGANLEYATMHNPVMRLEQINLRDSATANPVPLEESRRPFTLKAEPYISALNVTKDWLRQGSTESDTSGSLIGTSSAESSNGPLPMAASMYPCPTIWDYGTEIGLLAARSVGGSAEAAFAFQNQILSSLYNPGDSGPEPIVVPNITLDDITPKVDIPPEKKPGCLSFFSLLALGVIILLIK